MDRDNLAEATQKLEIALPIRAEQSTVERQDLYQILGSRDAHGRIALVLFAEARGKREHRHFLTERITNAHQ